MTPDSFAAGHVVPEPDGVRGGSLLTALGGRVRGPWRCSGRGGTAPHGEAQTDHDAEQTPSHLPEREWDGPVSYA